MSKGERLLWPDAAKGFCILLVVLVHLTSKNYLVLGWDIPDPVELFWVRLSEFLTPIRMPLFFAISGFFVAKYVHRSWPEIRGKRLASAYYLFLVWYLLQSLFYLLDLPLTTSKPESVAQFLLGLVFGYSGTWYLYALPVYFLITWALARWPMAALAGAAMLSMLSAAISLIGNGESICQHLFYFMAAAYLPRIIKRLAVRTRPWMLAGRVLGFTVASLVVSEADRALRRLDLDTFPVRVAMGATDLGVGVLGVVAGVAVFAWSADRLRPVARVGAWIGMNTLSIYVIHLPLLAVLNAVMIGTTVPLWVAVSYPLLGTLALVAVCLAIHRLLLGAGAGWLFSSPRRIQIAGRLGSDLATAGQL